MGMFDEVRYLGDTYQTKAFDRALMEYEITDDGHLRRHVHEWEWRDDPAVPIIGGHFKSIRDWWEDMPDFHGDIRIYRFSGERSTGDWVEYEIRFTHGRIERVRRIEQADEEIPTDHVAESS